MAGLGKRPHGSARVVDSIFVAKLTADVAKGKKRGDGKALAAICGSAPIASGLLATTEEGKGEK